jgi:hypothetical protein
MKRFQLFEFEDLSWFPSQFRQIITDFLQYQLVIWNMYSAIVPKIKEVMQKTNCDRIIDLCSGSGGELLQIQENLSRQENYPVSALLTDKYPNVEAYKRICQVSKGKIDYIGEPVDATNVPENLMGFRTIFTAFHHFPPTLAKKILQDAFAKKAAIGIFEHTERKPLTLAIMFFLAPLNILFQTPLIRPFKLSRLFWTYVIPVAPFVFTWDCLVSHVRTYSPEDLQGLIADMHNENYIWEIGQVRAEKLPIELTYLIGYPTSNTIA